MGVRQDVAVHIGSRLRAGRQARGLTITQVAEATGLTKGFISRLERDEVSPSVASLVAVCAAIDLPVGHLFEPPETLLVRAGEGRRINLAGSGLEEFVLSNGGQPHLQVVHSVMRPGGRGGQSLHPPDSAMAFGYVLSGTIDVVLLERTVRLERGDAVTFPGHEPHTWANPSSSETAHVLWVLVSDG